MTTQPDMLKDLEADTTKRAAAESELAYYDGIVDALLDLGHKARAFIKEVNSHLKYVPVIEWEYSTRQPSIDIVAQYSSSGFYPRPNGKYSLQVWTHDYNRKTWPQRKDGSFNYEAIAQFLIEDEDKAVKKKKQSQVYASNQTIADGVCADLGISKYGSTKGFKVEASKHGAEKPVQATFTISRLMTAEEAKAFHAMLVEAGLIKTD